MPKYPKKRGQRDNTSGVDNQTYNKPSDEDVITHNLVSNEFHGSRKNFRKRSFLQTVKKRFMKTKPRSAGTRLDDNIYEYFLRVLEISRQTFSDDEEKRAFVENVFAESEGHEVEYSQNQLVSRIIEDLLPHSSEITKQRFISAFVGNLEVVTFDVYACHVTKTILRLCTACVVSSINETIQDSKDENREETSFIKTEVDLETNFGKCFTFIIAVSDYLFSNLQGAMDDMYGNHVLRTLLLCLSGFTEKADDILSTRSFDTSKNNEQSQQFLKGPGCLPKKFKKHLKKITSSMIEGHSLSDYMLNTLASGLLQSLLISLFRTNQTKTINSITEKFLDLCCSNDSKTYVKLLTSQDVVHIFETLIMVSSDENVVIIHERFNDKWAEMVLNSHCNHAVQKFINRCPDEKQFTQLYKQLRPTFEDLIRKKYFGVLLSLCKACGRFSIYEDKFTKDLITALDCKNEQSNLFLQLLKMASNHDTDKFDQSDVNIGFYGAVLVQEMLKFKKSRKMAESIVDVDSAKLVNILTHPVGSRIANVFFSNEVHFCKDMQIKMIDKLKGRYTEIATKNKGFFTIESIWRVATMKQKHVVAEELKEKESVISNVHFGNKTLNLVGVSLFKADRKKWTQIQNNLTKKHDLFAGIIKK